MLIHPDEARDVWFLETRSFGGRWKGEPDPRRSLLDFLEWHARDHYDVDFIVGVRFRNLETGERVYPSEAYETIIQAVDQLSAKVVGMGLGRAARIGAAIREAKTNW